MITTTAFGDTGRHGDLLAFGRRVAERFVGQEGVDSVYLGGSLTAGLGSATSDVDIFVLMDDGVGTVRPSEQIVEEGMRADVEYYRLDAIRQKVVQATEYRPALSGLGRRQPVNSYDLDLVVRLAVSVTVSGSPALDALKARLAENADALRRTAVTLKSLAVNQHFEDLRGVYADGDLDTARYIGFEMLTAAGKALCAGAGDLYVGNKWVYTQLKRSLGEKFDFAYFRSLAEGAWVEQPSGYRTIVSLAQTFLIAAQTLGWDAPYAHRWPQRLPARWPPRRDVEMMPLRIEEGILLNAERKRQFVVKPYLGLLWGLAGDPDEARYTRSALAASLLSRKYTNINEHVCRTALDEFRNLELLVADAVAPGSSVIP